MASENIKDHKFLDLLDLSDSEVEEWIPNTHEEWDVTDEEDDPEHTHQERSVWDDRSTNCQCAGFEDSNNRLHLVPIPINNSTEFLCDLCIYWPFKIIGSKRISVSSFQHAPQPIAPRSKGNCQLVAQKVV
ncbi:hypothetical protein PoB_003107000 [Plakobranchus ocellatus]|uniref:Uncharacterized protein n=1 Tax=Plakobranchus ocellatus TaxID=259542 RepID=A0AAV4AB03_9GAST|nr:hypothetical protein PoB_003107000 [Plakobranchus ocellatus]